MKNKLIFFAIFCSVIYNVHAQGLKYNNYRIACSAYGNAQPDLEHKGKYSYVDPDDWGATPAALAFLAKKDLQDKLVHFSYNNFMPSPAHTTVRNYMKEGVDGSIKRWDFNKKVFFDVGTDKKKAVKHLVKEIEKSTPENLLFFL